MVGNRGPDPMPIKANGSLSVGYLTILKVTEPNTLTWLIPCRRIARKQPVLTAKLQRMATGESDSGVSPSPFPM